MIVMSWLLSAVMSPVYRLGALIGTVVVAIAAIYAKGRSDANARHTIRSYKETQDAIEATSRARAAVERLPADRLRDNDGWKRD